MTKKRQGEVLKSASLAFNFTMYDEALVIFKYYNEVSAAL